MAKNRSSGSARNGRDSCGKRLGVKCFDGQTVNTGSIIMRQLGTKFHAGKNVMQGKDHTLFASCEGVVKFDKERRRVAVVAKATA